MHRIRLKMTSCPSLAKVFNVEKNHALDKRKAGLTQSLVLSVHTPHSHTVVYFWPRFHVKVKVCIKKFKMMNQSYHVLP